MLTQPASLPVLLQDLLRMINIQEKKKTRLRTLWDIS